MAKTNTSAFFVESIPVNFTCDQVNSQDKDGYSVFARFGVTSDPPEFPCEFQIILIPKHGKKQVVKNGCPGWAVEVGERWHCPKVVF